jgi:hypothetical protein
MGRRLDLAAMTVWFALPFGVAGPRQHLLDSAFMVSHRHRAGGLEAGIELVVSLHCPRLAS